MRAKLMHRNLRQRLLYARERYTWTAQDRYETTAISAQRGWVWMLPMTSPARTACRKFHFLTD